MSGHRSCVCMSVIKQSTPTTTGGGVDDKWGMVGRQGMGFDGVTCTRVLFLLLIAGMQGSVSLAPVQGRK